MRHWTLLLFLLIAGWLSASAQRYLQMERRGSYKVKRYSPGDEVTFRLRGAPTWYSEEIREILIDDNLILFANRAVPVEDISHFRRFGGRRWSIPVWRQLYIFGVVWFVFSLGDALIGGTLDAFDFIVPGAAGALGFLIQKIFRRRTYKMSDKRRLRLLDLSFSPLPAGA